MMYTNMKQIALDMPHIRNMAQTYGGQGAAYADERLVGFAQEAMREKLARSRAKGRGGWWDADACSVEFLKQLLKEHIDKGDMVDVMNLAAMIYVREAGDTPPASE